MLSVDGADFCIAMGWSKSFYSYKFKKSGLRYEVGLCIKTGDICWWSGPYAPGIWNDLSIFVVGRLDMYRTKVLLYRTMVLLARPTKVRR